MLGNTTYCFLSLFRATKTHERLYGGVKVPLASPFEIVICLYQPQLLYFRGTEKWHLISMF